jgi:putative hemolysin
MSDVVLQLLVVLILVLVEALFVAAEISLVTLRHSRVDQLIDEGHRGASRVKHLIEDPARFLAVAQIGVTFVGFLASAFAAVNLADRLAVVLKDVPVLKDAAGGVALLIVTILLSGFFIVFGELVPKTVALARPTSWEESSARW